MVLLDGILFGLLAIYVLTCIYRNIFQYRVFGLSLGLLSSTLYPNLDKRFLSVHNFLYCVLQYPNRQVKHSTLSVCNEILEFCEKALAAGDEL